jgi:hypothetical protein
MSDTPIANDVFIEVGPVLTQMLTPTEMRKVVVLLERELNLFKEAGIVEIAIRNPNVKSYMGHWEGRALKAETENQRLVAGLKTIANWDFRGNRPSEQIMAYRILNGEEP